MTEILTESFCERCGTRYTFESGNRKRGRLGKVRTLSKGLRNYVLSDESTLSEAFADARSDDTQSVSADQLDAFHRTFNFCMSCRQYTCENCWNEPEGRCLSCAPNLGTEILPAAFPDLEPYVAEYPTNGHLEAVEPETNGHVADELAWPEIDLPSTRIARALGDDEAQLLAAEAVEATDAPVELIGVSETPEVESRDAGDAIAAVAAAEALEAVADAEPWQIDGLVRPVETETEVIVEPVEALAAADVAAELEGSDALAPIAAVEAEAGVETKVEPAAASVEPEAVDVTPVAASEPAAAEIADVEAESDAPVIVPRIVPRSAASRSAVPEERAAAAAAQTSALLAKFRPGQSLDDAIAAYEAELAKARGVEAADLDVPAEVPTELRSTADEPVDALAATPLAVEPEPMVAEGLAAAAVVAEVVEPETPVVEVEAAAEVVEAETPADAPVEPAVAAISSVIAQAALPEPETVEPEPVIAQAETVDREVPVSESRIAESEPVVAEVEPVTVEPLAAEPEPVSVTPDVLAAAVIAADAPEAAPADADADHEAARIAAIAAAAAVAATAAPEPEPEPVKPSPKPQPVAAEPAPAPAAPKVDIVEQPAWRIVAPEAPTDAPAPAPWPVAPTAAPNGQPQFPQATADPQWPAPQQNGAPQWPSSPAPYVPSRTAQPEVGRIGGRTVVRGVDAIWAASNQEVLAKPAATGAAIAPCRSCGLSLSANARFCRRCGTRQG